MKWILWTVSWYVVCNLEERWWYQREVKDRPGADFRGFMCLVDWIIWVVGMVKFW